MAQIGTLISFTKGTKIVAADVNQNFSDVRAAFNASAVLTDLARTILVSHTFAALTFFTAGLSVSGASTFGAITAGAISGTSINSTGGQFKQNGAVILDFSSTHVWFESPYTVGYRWRNTANTADAMLLDASGAGAGALTIGSITKSGVLYDSHSDGSNVFSFNNPGDTYFINVRTTGGAGVNNLELGVGVSTTGWTRTNFVFTNSGSLTLLAQNNYLHGGDTNLDGSGGTGGYVMFTAQAGTTATYGAWLTNNAYWTGSNWIQPRGTGTSSHLFGVTHNLDFVWWYNAAGGVDGGTITPTKVMDLGPTGALTVYGATNPYLSLIKTGATAHTAYVQIAGDNLDLYITPVASVLTFSAATGAATFQGHAVTMGALTATTGTFSALLLTVASATGGAGFRVPAGAAPTAPVDGDLWYDGTNVKFRVGGTTKTFTLV